MYGVMDETPTDPAAVLSSTISDAKNNLGLAAILVGVIIIGVLLFPKKRR